MEETKLISVIVPVYNAAAFLPRCIESLLGQTYTSLEIICVDDGSTDNSLTIMREYAAKDARIKVIHQENAGVSAARNAGLEAASGEYVAFVDSDDWVEPNSFLLVINSFEEDVDVVCMGCVVDGDVSSRAELQEYCNYFPIQKTEVTPALFRYKNLTLWNKVFRLDLIQRNHLRFHAGISYGEDVSFVCCVLPCCRNVKGVTEQCYHYVMQPNSLMHSPDRQLRMETDLLAAWTSVYEFYRHSGYLKRFWPMMERMFNELYRWFSEWPPRNGNIRRRVWQFVKRCGLDVRSSHPGIMQLCERYRPPWIRKVHWIKEDRACYGVCGLAVFSVAYEDGCRTYRVMGRRVMSIRET